MTIFTHMEPETSFEEDSQSQRSDGEGEPVSSDEFLESVDRVYMIGDLPKTTFGPPNNNQASKAWGPHKPHPPDKKRLHRGNRRLVKGNLRRAMRIYNSR